MNRSITSTSNSEQKSPRNKSPGLHRWILSNSGVVTIPILIKHFQKHEGRNIPSSFCEAAITMNQNEAEMPHKEENCRLISLMNINAKILRKMLPKKKNLIKRIIHQIQVGFIPGFQRFFTICKSINVIHYINKLKGKNHMIISIDAEKDFDKV